jgi:adenylosuccinate synthase
MTKKNAGHGIVVVGGQWGDEGKGRIVDSLSADCALTVRFHGGNNAGHSLHFDGKSLVLHLIPCGIVRATNIAVIGNGVVIDPEVLLKEMNDLRQAGIKCSPSNLKISLHAHVILPIHKSLDQKRESDSKSFLGTTKRGIGPCYEDKIARFGIRMGDLVRPPILRSKLEKLLNHHDEKDPTKLNEVIAQCLTFGDQLKAFLCDSGEYISQMLENNARVLFEGAQGALLDVDHGSYPFVTSSNCVAAQASIGSGVGPKWLNEVLMVSKAYCTRVGEGPFLTELDQAGQEIFRQVGNEFGATTGRPRRCGWLDLPALKYAARINGATGLVITKFDILAGLGPIKIATGYRSAAGQDLSFSDAMDLVLAGEQVLPVYREFAPIESLPSSIKKMSDLPESFRQICELIEREVGAPIMMISYGKERGQEISFR